MTYEVRPGQRRRSVAIALGLLALVVLFFMVTMVRLQGNVANRMKLEGKTSSPTQIIIEEENGVSGDSQ